MLKVMVGVLKIPVAHPMHGEGSCARILLATDAACRSGQRRKAQKIMPNKLNVT